MRGGMVIAAILGLGLMTLPTLAQADGCYMCQEGGYVRFQGSDTFDKRKKAKEQFGCTVSGTTSNCSNARGTVAQAIQQTPQATMAARGVCVKPAWLY